MLAFNDDSLKAAIATGEPVVVDFWATWCGPCRALAPIFEEVAAKFASQATFGKFDVDSGEDSPVDYGIRAIPTMLFFKGGQLVDRVTGTLSREQLAEKVQALL